MFSDQDTEEMELGLETAEADMALAKEKCGLNATHAEIMAEFDRLTDLRYDALMSIPE